MLLWIDGFDDYGSEYGSSAYPINSLLRRWAHCVDVESHYYTADPQLDVNGRAIQFHGDNLVLTAPDLTTDATMVVGFRYQHGADVAATILALLDGCDSDTPTVFLKLNDSNYLEVWRNDAEPTLLTTSTDPIDTAAWYYVEFKVVCDATSAGSVELHLNGTAAFPAYAGVTKTDQQSDGYNTTFRLQNGVSQRSLFDDLYCLDSYDLNSDGSNTTFLGPRCVYTLLPAADVAGEQWLCSSGTDHYAMVRDEWNTDDDATYVWTNQDWVSDFYTCDALPDGVTGINGIMLVADVRKAENGSWDAQLHPAGLFQLQQRRQHVEWQHGHLGQHALEVLLGHLRARPRQIGGVGQRGLGCRADRHFILARWRDGSVSRRAKPCRCWERRNRSPR